MRKGVKIIRLAGHELEKMSLRNRLTFVKPMRVFPKRSFYFSREAASHQKPPPQSAEMIGVKNRHAMMIPSAELPQKSAPFLILCVPQGVQIARCDKQRQSESVGIQRLKARPERCAREAVVGIGQLNAGMIEAEFPQRCSRNGFLFYFPLWRRNIHRLI